MFILQDGKLYIQNKSNEIIGVDISIDEINKIKGTEIKLGKHKKLTAFETKCKFQINENNPYTFPKPKEVKKEKKEVKVDGTTPKTKKSTGKSK